MIKLTIGENEKEQRLDRFMLKLLNNATRAQVFSWIRKKTIRVNGKSAQENQRLMLGDEVEVRISEESFETLSKKTVIQQKAAAKLDIVYEDSEILVVNKPAGLLTHPDKDEYQNTLATQVQLYLQDSCSRTFRPASIQRLDKNTSGLVIFGKTYDALKKYNELMREREIKKFYLCIVEGNVEESGEVEGYICKDNDANTVSIRFEPDAYHQTFVHTRYTPLKQGKEHTLLEVELLTGRSHQIRASLGAIGHPIYGDAKYGAESRRKKFQVLHAWKVILEDREFTCPSAEMDMIWKTLNS